MEGKDGITFYKVLSVSLKGLLNKGLLNKYGKPLKVYKKTGEVLMN